MIRVTKKNSKTMNFLAFMSVINCSLIVFTIYKGVGFIEDVNKSFDTFKEVVPLIKNLNGVSDLIVFALKKCSPWLHLFIFPHVYVWEQDSFESRSVTKFVRPYNTSLIRKRLCFHNGGNSLLHVYLLNNIVFSKLLQKASQKKNLKNPILFNKYTCHCPIIWNVYCLSEKIRN